MMPSEFKPALAFPRANHRRINKKKITELPKPKDSKSGKIHGGNLTTKFSSYQCYPPKMRSEMTSPLLSPVGGQSEISNYDDS